MPKYLVEASYTAEGAKGLMKAGGSARRAEVQKMVESLKGRHTPIEKNAPSKRRMAHQPNMRKQDYQLESLSESNGKSNFVSRREKKECCEPASNTCHAFHKESSRCMASKRSLLRL